MKLVWFERDKGFVSYASKYLVVFLAKYAEMLKYSSSNPTQDEVFFYTQTRIFCTRTRIHILCVYMWMCVGVHVCGTLYPHTHINI